MSAASAAEARRRLGPAPELSDWPSISVVVLGHNGRERLRRLLAGLRDRTDYPRIELIFVDNASTDGSLGLAREVEAPFPVVPLANSRNESFSDACNQGAAAATGELLLFLNDDAEPFEPGWLRELAGCLRGRGTAAVVPTLVEFASDSAHGHRIEQRGHRIGVAAGGLVPIYRDRGEDLLGPLLGKDVEVVSGAAACLLIERGAFDAVGGFTHGYWYGGEDTDLALKLRERGMSLACSGRSLLAHAPNSTLQETAPELRAGWARGNRRLFMERWGPRVRREFELDRLRGGGLWAEPCARGSSAWGSTDGEIEALAFCFEAPAEGEPAEGPSPELLAAALQRRGRRATTLRGERVNDLVAFDYDVAVRCGGSRQGPPSRSRLDLPWSAPGLPAGGSADEVARRLIAEADRLALALGFRRRIVPPAV